jgi:lycopene elongase/hydratase (flavuxanthin-forming)
MRRRKGARGASEPAAQEPATQDAAAAQEPAAQEPPAAVQPPVELTLGIAGEPVAGPDVGGADAPVGEVPAAGEATPAPADGEVGPPLASADGAAAALAPDIETGGSTPAGARTAAGALASDFVGGWRNLLELSDPRSWPTTALPFAVAAYDVQRGLSPALILGTLYFLGPFHLLLQGADPSAVPAERALLTRVAIALTNLPLLALLVLLGGASTGVALLVTVGAALAYSVPPIRTRERPILDSVTRALLIVLPAVCGSLMAGLAVAGLPWLPLLALASWAMATSALAAIANVTADEAVGRTSIATALGRRPTAAVSFVGYAVTAVAVASLGSLGVLAALGLALYLLLPMMVIVAPRHDPTAMEGAAGRAWSGHLGLRFLVGAWLAILLLRHWGIVAGVSSLELAIATSAAAIGFAGWNIVMTRLATRRRRTRPDPERQILSMTIVVASHDDGEQLAVCVEAMMEQTYADTAILVVDTGSTDGSPELAAEILGGAGYVIAAPPTPDGWLPRNWALWTGVQQSQGDLVLFLDVDTLLVPVATRIIVEQLEERRWDLLSGLARDEMPTVGERASVPGFALLRLGFRPIWLAAWTRGRLRAAAFASGSLSLVRRDAYLAVGGHAAYPDSREAGVEIARALAREGRRAGTTSVADLAASRSYPGVDAVIGAWRRDFLPTVSGSLAFALLAIAAQALAYVVPMVLPLVAFVSGAEARTLVASCIPLFLLGFARFALVLTQRHPLTTVVWHPVTIAVTLFGQTLGLLDHVIGRAPAEARGEPAMAGAVSTDQPG